MRKIVVCAAVVLAAAASGHVAAQAKFDPETIIRLERGALERWGKGDPDGYVEIMAPNITYYDPTNERRIDGRDAVRKQIEPIRGKLRIERSEILNPQVTRDGDIAVFTFNTISHGAQLGDGPKRDAHWQVTEVYKWIGGRWLIVHSHFSNPAPAPPR